MNTPKIIYDNLTYLTTKFK